MAKKAEKKTYWLHGWRRISQVVFLVALNPYFLMYRGFCFPAMNCWACPAAAYGCPVGAIGELLAAGAIPFLTIGVMLIAGAFLGRMICGWVCPFGLIQDLFAMIPVKRIRLPKMLSYSKYLILVGTVILVPLFIGLDTKLFFCKLCPAGTLEASIMVRIFGSRFEGGAPAVADVGEEAGGEKDEEDDDDGGALGGGDSMGDPDLWGDEDGDDWLAGGSGAAPVPAGVGGDTIRFLTTPRMWVLYGFLLAFVFIRRPFCRVICPIGAVFALLNRFSLFRMRIRKDTCKECNICAKRCPVDNKLFCSPSSDDCIRCLECVDNCIRGSVKPGLIATRAREDYWE